MVLASVKLSMPSGPPRRKRKGSGDVPRPSPDDRNSRNKRSGGGPRTRKGSSSASTASIEAASFSYSSSPESREADLHKPATSSAKRPMRGEEASPPPPRRTVPLRIKVSLKRRAVSEEEETSTEETADDKYTNHGAVVAAASRRTKSKNNNAAHAEATALAPPLSDTNTSGATPGSQEEEEVPRDVRWLIEEHRQKDPNNGGGSNNDRPGVWVCRHCGAQRKEAKRGAALSNLLNHLKQCVKVDVAAFEHPQEPHNSTRLRGLSFPEKPPPPASAKAGRKPAAAPTPADELASAALSSRIVPCRSDVCLGDGTNRGYRLLQDAVKGVRMSVNEENWEYMAVSQTLERLRRLHAHPNVRFLVRTQSSDRQWVEATNDDVRKKILALYRRYFRFKPVNKGVAHDWSEAMNGEAYPHLQPNGGFDVPLASATGSSRTTHGRGSDLDAGIIRHVLIEEEVASPPPDSDDTTGCRSAVASVARSGVGTVDGDTNASHVEKGAKTTTRTTPSGQLTASHEGESAIEPSWQSSVYKEVRSMIAAKWYTLEQEREQRAVQLEQHMAELRAAQSSVAKTKELVEEARARFSALAFGAGVEVEDHVSSPHPSAGEIATNPRDVVVDTSGSHDGGLVDRIKKRVADLKDDLLELERELLSWNQRTSELEVFVQEMDQPTEDYLRADARLAELEAQAEFLLNNV